MASLLAITALIVNRALASDPCLNADPLIQTLPDSAFTATSSYDEGSQPFNARYYPGDGWSAGTNITTDENPIVGYLTVDLGSVVTVCAVGTRATKYNESSTEYKLSYSTDGTTFTDFVGQTDLANGLLYGPDRYEVSELRYETDILGSGQRGIKARYVRFTPMDWTWWPSMCVEAYGYEGSGTKTGSAVPDTMWLGITAICGAVFVLIVVTLVCAYVRLKTDSASKYMRMHEMGMSDVDTEAENKKLNM